ncbi:MAG: putative hyperosmotically inducible periplasmic protein [Myxococcaceae bacterium]|nr:putative hyperosmotically inducible periplasmic protein [Myxococcaceae bacterium]
MKSRYFSALALLIVGGCAHHTPKEPPAANALADRNQGEAHGARARDRKADDEDKVGDASGEERVELRHAGNQHHLASMGRDLPAADKDKKDPNAPASAESYGTSADNTRVNERDRADTALTPMDQSESEPDRELLQRIRRAVIADDSLSFTAKNVKIITRDGQVTLRGAVNNEREKTTIEKAAREAAGPKHVTNELEVSK